MLLRCFHPEDCTKDYSNWRSKPPRDRKQFDEAAEFILGHLTSSTFLESIVSNGLIPDLDKERVKDDNLASDCESVYLLASYDSFYLERATRHHGGRGIIVEVRVARSKLVADENQFGEGQIEKVDSIEALYLSMCGGACKHTGVILPDNILSIRDDEGTVHFKNSNQ